MSVVVVAATAVTGFGVAEAWATLPIFYGPSEAPGNGGIATPRSAAVNNLGVSVAGAQPIVDGSPKGHLIYRWTATPNPSVFSLAGLTGSTSTVVAEAAAINDAGIVVGISSLFTGAQQGDGTESHAVKYAPGTFNPIDLGTLGNTIYDNSAATGINASGTIVGSASGGSTIDAHFDNAVRWVNGSTTPTPLGVLSFGPDGHYVSHATAINNVGTIIGDANIYGVGGTNLGNRPVRWSPSGVPAELGHIGVVPDGVFLGQALAINASSVATGFTETYNGNSAAGARAVVWKTGGSAATKLADAPNMVDLNGTGLTEAYDINDAGTIAGFASHFATPDAASFGFQALRWSPDGTVATILNPRTGDDTAVAVLINNIGAVGGVSATASGSGDFVNQHAVVWLPGSTTPLDLATLVVNPGTTSFIPNNLVALTETGFVTGDGLYKPSPAAATQERVFTMLIPAAGTYGRGDANFDTKVDFDDLVILAQHYNEQNPTQNIHIGDFDLSGSVDFNDLVVLAQNYNSSASLNGLGGADFAADWALAQSLAPEPALMGIVAAMALCRRNDRRKPIGSSRRSAMLLAADGLNTGLRGD